MDDDTDQDLLADAQTPPEELEPVDVAETGDDPEAPEFQPPENEDIQDASDPGDAPGVEEPDHD